MRKLIITILCIAILVCLPIHASAHPGGTDSHGGHHDRSTGEYHYHHGYSAHQHKDIDGDGKKDCPYDFDDKSNPLSKVKYKNSESSEEETPLFTWKDIPTIGVFSGLAMLFLSQFAMIFDKGFAEKTAILSFKIILFTLPFMILFSLF